MEIIKIIKELELISSKVPNRVLKIEGEFLDNKEYTFKDISNDILEVLHHLKIEKSHFIGISLGTILIRDLAERNPEMVESMIMGGAILKLNTRSKFLMGFGNVFKSVVPYIFLYKLFAFIIMPKKNHKESLTEYSVKE